MLDGSLSDCGFNDGGLLGTILGFPRLSKLKLPTFSRALSLGFAKDHLPALSTASW